MFKKTNINIFSSKKMITIIFLGYVINFLYSKEVPLINSIFGIGTYYKDIATIPTFYPLLNSMNVFFVIYNFYLYLNLNEKRHLHTSIILLIPFLITMGRGLIVMAITPCVLMYLSQNIKRFVNKKTYKVIIFLLIFTFLFGYLGNLRTTQSHLKNISPTERILYVGNATEQFWNKPIPKEYFWAYIYVASPISNFDNFTQYDYEGSTFGGFVAYNFLPQSIRKRVIDENSIDKKIYLIVDEFNVSTAYGIPFYQLGWIGVLLYQLIYYLIFIFMFIIVQRSYYQTIFLSLYSMTSIYSLFSNIFVLDIVAIPIILCVLLSVKKRIVFRRRFVV
ncbi:O-antigen polymerase [Clostridium sp. KNHs214]|uniref:O-antigen polymerase n=1 Tax=Clostridium sp. KNHs214 TaxID=1540257 RepID=UPI001A9A4C0E|nr:O-antigen polymerase [Clostridium sp. KNHs214]